MVLGISTNMSNYEKEIVTRLMIEGFEDAAKEA